MLRIDHLQASDLKAVLKGARLDSAQAHHLRSCARCRDAIGRVVINHGLLPRTDASEAPLRPLGSHLSGKQLAALHAQAFQRESLDQKGLTNFIAAMAHLTRCDPCYARFFEYHEALTPSAASMDRAVRTFEAGQSARRAGTLSIVRTLQGLWQDFQPARMRGEEALWPETRLALREADTFLSDHVVLSVARRRSAKAHGPQESGISASLEQLARVIKRQQSVLAGLRNGPFDSSDLAGSRDGVDALMQGVEELRDLLREQSRCVDQLSHDAGQVAREAMAAAEREREFRTRPYVAEATRLELDNLTLTVVTHWRGESGEMRLEASRSTGGVAAPAAGIKVTPALHSGEAGDPVVTDASGRASFVIDRTISRLDVQTPDSEKPWVIAVEVSEIGPLT